jgi:hypothetical protein
MKLFCPNPRQEMRSRPRASTSHLPVIDRPNLFSGD